MVWEQPTNGIAFTPLSSTDRAHWSVRDWAKANNLGQKTAYGNFPIASNLFNCIHEGEVCSGDEYCCPDAKKCLTPTKTSCAASSAACGATDVCCPLTKICVTAGESCVSPCAAGSFCCPDARHCLSP